MSKTDEAALVAAKHSRIWTIAAFASGAAALAMGFASFFGIFDGFIALAVALMATLTLLALFCGAQGASLRSSARVMGWMPEKELNAEAIQAKNEYLNAILKQEMKGDLKEACAKTQLEDATSTNAKNHSPASPGTPNSLAENDTSKVDPDAALEAEALESIEDLAERERAAQVFEGVRETERELVREAGEIVKEIEELGSAGPDAIKEAGLTEEELIVAAAEALLAEAASEKPREKGEFPSDAESMAFELPEYANKTLAQEPEDEDFDVIPATAKSRQIAKKRIAIVDRMLSRTEDVFALARDLARAQTKDKALANLPEMLRNNPMLEDPDMPKVKPIKLSRNNRHWMGGNSDRVPAKVFDALLSLEATFNINQDILWMFGEKPEMEELTSTQKRVLAILKRTGETKPDYSARIDYIPCAYPDVNPEEVCGEWALRSKIANAVENAGLPFRISFDMMANASAGKVLISMEIPRPDCFFFIAKGKEDREAFARDYALRSAIFMARVALGAGPRNNPVTQAIICCHPRNEAKNLISIDANAETMPKLEALAGFLAPMPVPIGYPAIRMLCEQNWLDPVTPHILPTDEIWNPSRYTTLPETSQAECYPRLTKVTGAKLECDLGTREEAPMEQAWVLLESLGESAESAVAAVKALKDSNENPSVQAGCDRVMRALVDGTAEPSQKEQLMTIFMGFNELAGALAFGLQAFTTKSEADVERTIEKLKELLTPELQISVMDDTETAFRYFHNVAERIHYNLNSNDERKVSLVPRTYYSANEMAVYLLCQMERPEEAQPYAKELLRIAPLSSNSAVTMARVLERQDRILEAIELVNQAIANASTVHDAALCYYRMAYLQWRMGREDLANASYRLTVALRTEISHQAQQELNELLESNKELEELTPSAACKKLDDAGVAIWDLEGFRDRMAQAAVLCADQTLFSVAAQLSLGLLEFQNDDALTDVYKSFSA